MQPRRRSPTGSALLQRAARSQTPGQSKHSNRKNTHDHFPTVQSLLSQLDYVPFLALWCHLCFGLLQEKPVVTANLNSRLVCVCGSYSSRSGQQMDGCKGQIRRSLSRTRQWRWRSARLISFLWSPPSATLMKVRNPGDPAVHSQTQPFKGGAFFLLRVKSVPLQPRGEQARDFHSKLRGKCRVPEGSGLLVCMSVLMDVRELGFIECAAWPASSRWSTAEPLVTLVGPADLWLGRMATVCRGSATLAEQWGQCVCGMNTILPCCHFMTGHSFTAKSRQTESSLMVIYWPQYPCEVHLCELWASCF